MPLSDAHAHARTALFPRPRRLELHGDGPAATTAAVTRTDASIPAAGFVVTIGDGPSGGVEVASSDDLGRRYGEAALAQLRAAFPGGLPAGTIADHPDLATRAFHFDVSRDRVPTMATLRLLVDLLALGRFNQLQLYTEHTFAYAGHDVVWSQASPLTGDEVEQLDGWCRDAGIELVANQNCFGHMERWLAHEPYRSWAECPDGVSRGGRPPTRPGVLAPTPANATFAHGLYAELLSHHTSTTINIGCDETFELGKGVSADDAAARGLGAVYVEHVLRLVEPLVAQGRKVQMWADVLRSHPADAAALATGTLAEHVLPFAWCYEAPMSDEAIDAMPPSVRTALDAFGIDITGFTSFASNVAPLVEQGIRFGVAPGLGGWNSFVGRSRTADANIRDALATAAAHGADAMLLTEWGDAGHHQPFSTMVGPLLLGGALAWGASANADLTPVACWDLVFGPGVGTLLDEAAGLAGEAGVHTVNGSPFAKALSPQSTCFDLGSADGALAAAAAVRLEELAAELAAVPIDDRRRLGGDLVSAELEVAAQLSAQGAWRLARRAGASVPAVEARNAALAATVDAFRDTWLARSRPGGLEDSAGRLLPDRD